MLKALKLNDFCLTTNQKVVGSNPAGLTMKEPRKAKKISLPGFLYAFWPFLNYGLLLPFLFRYYTLITPKLLGEKR